MKKLKYDVFLSHNSLDKPAVEWLAKKLQKKTKIKVFLDIRNLIPGEPWQEALEEALDRSQTAAVFLGPAGIGPWQNEEMRRALDVRVMDNKRRVIPVLLPGINQPDENDLPGFLQRLTWVDFQAGLDDETAFRRLVAGIQGKEPEGEMVAELPSPPPQPAGRHPERKTEIHTGGGAYIKGNVNITHGDFVGRDKIINAEQGGVAIGGNARNVNIASGENSTAGSFITLQEEYVQYIFEKIKSRPETVEIDKEDLKAAVEEVRAEDRKGAEASESFIGQRLRNIRRIAPDILDVVLAAIGNPVAGFGMVAKKVAEKMKEDMG